MNKELSVGVKILLERMKTNPEEFGEHGRFRRYVVDAIRRKNKLVMHEDSIVLHLTDEEVDLVCEQAAKIRRKEFDEYILKAVLAPEENKADETAAFQSMYPSPRVTTNTNGINTVYHPLQQNPLQIEIMQKQQDLLKLQAERMQEQTKPKSFFASICSAFK